MIIIFGCESIRIVTKTGEFYCPCCKNNARFKRKSIWKFFHLYFIPLVPIYRQAKYVKCRNCMSYFETSIIKDQERMAMMFQDGGMGGSMGGVGGRMGGMGGSRAPSPQRYDAIPPGTVVSLKGLQNAPDRNGDRGVVKQYIPQSSRYVVVLEESEETMSVKPSNLLQHVHVRIHDIQSQPELNGNSGTIIAWCPQKERYNINIKALKKVVSLKPGNVVLDKGTVAQLTGLSRRPELNGKWGTIKEWIRDTNKYDVQLLPQHVIRVNVENMRV